MEEPQGSASGNSPELTRKSTSASAPSLAGRRKLLPVLKFAFAILLLMGGLFVLGYCCLDYFKTKPYHASGYYLDSKQSNLGQIDFTHEFQSNYLLPMMAGGLLIGFGTIFLSRRIELSLLILAVFLAGLAGLVTQYCMPSKSASATLTFQIQDADSLEDAAALREKVDPAVALRQAPSEFFEGLGLKQEECAQALSAEVKQTPGYPQVELNLRFRFGLPTEKAEALLGFYTDYFEACIREMQAAHGSKPYYYQRAFFSVGAWGQYAEAWRAEHDLNPPPTLPPGGVMLTPPPPQK